MGKRKTHDEYVAELAVKNPGVTVVGEYVGASKEIEHICGGCGELWLVKPNNLLSGNSKNCKSCGGREQKTHDEYVAQLAKVNSNIEVVGTYINASTAIDHRCGRCGEIWSVEPTRLLTKRTKGCGSCSGKKRKTHDEYVAELAVKNPGIRPVESYVNIKTSIKHQCDKGHFFKVAPNNSLYGRPNPHGCNVCSGQRPEPYDDFLRRERPTIVTLEPYKAARRPIEHLCLTCSYKWFVKPDHIRNSKSGCPSCGHASTDANVFYVWENANDVGVYKAGITSERIGDKRVRICAEKNNMNARIIMMLKTPHARDIERRALELGDDPRYPDTIDGYTEFRRYSDAELGEVWRMAVGA